MSPTSHSWWSFLATTLSQTENTNGRFPQPIVTPRTGGGVHGYGWRREVHDNALRGIVPLDLKFWLKRSPTASERTMYSHAYESLAKKALVKKWHFHESEVAPEGFKTTHLELLPAGLKLAAELLRRA